MHISPFYLKNSPSSFVTRQASELIDAYDQLIVLQVFWDQYKWNCNLFRKKGVMVSLQGQKMEVPLLQQSVDWWGQPFSKYIP
jgi:hypothetical protein